MGVLPSLTHVSRVLWLEVTETYSGNLNRRRCIGGVWVCPWDGREGSRSRPGAGRCPGSQWRELITAPYFTFANQMSTTVANFQRVSGGGSGAWLKAPRAPREGFGSKEWGDECIFGSKIKSKLRGPWKSVITSKKKKKGAGRKREGWRKDREERKETKKARR